MKRRLLTVAIAVLTVACSAPAATPTPVPPTTAPAAGVSVACPVGASRPPWYPFWYDGSGGGRRTVATFQDSPSALAGRRSSTRCTR